MSTIKCSNSSCGAMIGVATSRCPFCGTPLPDETYSSGEPLFPDETYSPNETHRPVTLSKGKLFEIVPDKEGRQPQKRKIGYGLRRAGVALFLVGILLCATMTPLFIIGAGMITPSLIIYAIGWITSKEVCPHCGNKVGHETKICPTCQGRME